MPQELSDHVTSLLQPTAAQPTPEQAPTPAPSASATGGTDQAVNYDPNAPAMQALNAAPAGALQNYARQAAAKAGISPELFAAQIQQESGFNPNAGSGAGARGVAQIVPQYHPGVDTSDPYASLDYAANLDRKLLDQYGGDWQKALIAYNGGGGAVAAWDSGQPYQESKTYVARILGNSQPKQGAVSGAQQAVSGAQQAISGAIDQGKQAVSSKLSDLSQFGDKQLSASESYAACGPAAAARFAQLYGRNPTLREATDLAAQVGWTQAGGMAGLQSESKLFDAMQIPHRTVGADWNALQREAQSGNPVVISTPGHYFTADNYDPSSGAFHVGASGTDLRGGSEWMTADQMQARMGQLQGGLVADHPNVPQASPLSTGTQAVQGVTSTVGQAASSVSNSAGTAARRGLQVIDDAAQSAVQSAQSGVQNLQNGAQQGLQTLANAEPAQTAAQPQNAPQAPQNAISGQTPANPLDAVKQKFNDALDSLGSVIQPVSSSAGQALSSAASDVGTAAQGAVSGAAQAAGGVVSDVGTAARQGADTAQSAVAGAPAAVDQVRQQVQDTIDSLPQNATVAQARQAIGDTLDTLGPRALQVAGDLPLPMGGTVSDLTAPLRGAQAGLQTIEDQRQQQISEPADLAGQFQQNVAAARRGDWGAFVRGTLEMAQKGVGSTPLGGAQGDLSQSVSSALTAGGIDPNAARVLGQVANVIGPIALERAIPGVVSAATRGADAAATAGLEAIDRLAPPEIALATTRRAGESADDSLARLANVQAERVRQAGEAQGTVSAVDAPTVGSITSRFGAKGEPGMRLEGAETAVPAIVYRDADGVARGGLNLVHDADGNLTHVAVAVDPAFQRQGIATAMYDAAKKAGYDVESVSGASGYTEAGAALTNARRAAPAMATANVGTEMQRNFLRDTVRVPSSDPRPQVQGTVGLPNEKLVYQDNLTHVVPEGTTVLYHETNVPSARTILDRIESGPRNQSPIFTSDNRDLALGQGGRGVALEFDPARANGGVAPQKPGLAFTSATGGGQEYTVTRTLPGAVQAIIVRNQRQADQLATNARVAARFDFANATPVEGGGLRIPYRPRTATEAMPAAPAPAPAVPTPRVAPEPTGFRAPETGATSEVPVVPTAAETAVTGARAAPGETVTATTPTARVTARVGEPPSPPAPSVPPPPAETPAFRAPITGRVTDTGTPQRVSPQGEILSPTTGQPVETAGSELAGNIRLPKFVQQPVADIIQQVHAADPARFEAARRGVVTDQMVRDLADEAGTTVNRVAAAWKPGKTANAETTLALRTALADRALRVRSAQNLLKLNPRSIDARNTLVEALNQHAALQEVVSGVTGEAGRVVRQFRQPVTGEQASLAALQRIAKNTHMSPEELADHLANVDLSDPQAVASLAKTLTGHSFADKAQALWYFNLLSSPVTWTKNLISNGLVAASRPIESLAAAGIDLARAGITGTERQRFMGEAPAEAFGMLHPDTLGSALKGAYRVMRTGVTPRELENPELAGRTEPFQGRLADLTVNVPGRVLSATDALFRTLNEQGSVYKLAYRQAAQEGTPVSGMADRINEIIRNPTKQLLDQAKAEGEYRIFQNKNAVGQAAMQVREAMPFGTGRFVLPFINTPVNVGAYALERSPLAVAKLAGSAAERSGGQLSDNIARMTLGSALAGYAATQGYQGNITGAAPDDPTERDAWQREGKQPYSIHAPNGVWYSYAALQPFSTLLAAGAAAGDAWKKGQNDPSTGLNPASLIAITGVAAGRAMIDQPWLQGLSGLVDMLTSSSGGPGQPTDPMKQISINAQRALASGVVPAGVRLLARAFDPTSRTSDPGFEGFGQQLAASIPGLTQNAPPRLGAFGQPIQRPGGSGVSVLNPFNPSPETDDPVEKELRRLQDGGYDVEPSLAGKRVTLIGEAIGLTPDQQRQYQMLSGVMTHDLLSSLLATDAYKSLPSDKQALVINRLGDRVADAARKTLYPSLLDQAVERKIAQTAQRQQATQPGIAPEEWVTRRGTGSAEAPTGAAPTGSANITVQAAA